MRNKYGYAVLPIASKLIKSGDAEFLEGKDPEDKTPKPILELDRVMGNDFEITSKSTSCAHVYTSGLATDFFNFGKIALRSRVHQKHIRTSRATQTAKHIQKAEKRIPMTWKEWGYSAGISTVWSAIGDVLGRNGFERLLFHPELKKTAYKHLPDWQKVLVGIPDKELQEVLTMTNKGKKVVILGGRVSTQALAELPDLLLIQTAIRRVEKGIPFKQAFLEVLYEKKWETAAGVISAGVGTLPEKARELFWNPTTKGGKIGSAVVKTTLTNPVSIVSCSAPIILEGGPQEREAAEDLAKCYNPETGVLKLSQQDLKYFSAIASDPNRTLTLKDVKKFFDRKVKGEVIHKSRAPRMLAASLPVALGYSVIPSIVEGVTAVVLPEGTPKEIVKALVSFLQVPAFAPAELLSANTVAALDRVAPPVVTGLSKLGRPMINALYTPLYYTKRALHVGASAWDPEEKRISKPEDPYKNVKAFKNAIQTNTDEMV